MTLGNLDASRDWGYAGDYVEGMWKMMQYQSPEEWVLATGKSITVKEFAQKAFDYVDLNSEDYIDISEKYFRPNEVDFLLGDATKAKSKLEWSAKTSIDQLVEKMVESDMKLAKRESVLIEEGLIDPTWENPTVN